MKHRLAITVIVVAFIAGLALRLMFAMPVADEPRRGDRAVPASSTSIARNGERSQADRQPIQLTPRVAEVLGMPTKGTRIAKLASFLSTADSAAIAELVKATENPFVIYGSELKFIMAQWVRIDPQAAIDYADQIAPTRKFGSISKNFPNYVWSAWARQDFEAARSAAEAHSDLALKMVMKLARADEPVPDAVPVGDLMEAALLAFEGARAGGGEAALRAAVERWAGRDPDAALEWALATAHYDLRKDAMTGVARGMAKRDPAGAADRLAEIQGGSFLAIVGEIWAQSDPAAAADKARSMDAGNAQKLLVYSIAKELADSDPHALLALLDDLDWRVVPNLSAIKALTAIAVESPREAIRSMARLPSEDGRKQVAEAAMIAWVSDDLAGAVSWVEALPDSAELYAFASGLGTAIAVSNPHELPVMPELQGASRQAYMNNFVKGMIDHDPAALVGWLGDFDTAEIRKAMNKNFKRWYWESGADAAAAYLLLEPADQKGGEIGDLANHWDRTDPVATAEWLAKLPVDKISRHTLWGTAERLVALDDESAAFAAEWAKGITDSTKREFVLEKMGK